MGRPSLNVFKTNVRLTPLMRARIEALVGANKMAEFIRQAINNELDRREAGRPEPTDD